MGAARAATAVRNKRVARTLNEAGIPTLLIDLLTEEEERVELRTRELRFDIGLFCLQSAGAGTLTPVIVWQGQAAPGCWEACAHACDDIQLSRVGVCSRLQSASSASAPAI
jgi:hypothetical protein